jgi:hypothetical protein
MSTHSKAIAGLVLIGVGICAGFWAAVSVHGFITDTESLVGKGVLFGIFLFCCGSGAGTLMVALHEMHDAADKKTIVDVLEAALEERNRPANSHSIEALVRRDELTEEC